MKLQIQVIATSIETKKGAKDSYQMLEITCKDLEKNKVGSKKLMSFAKPKQPFETLSVAKPSDVFDIELIKNETSGYWDWTNAERGSGVVHVGSQSTAGQTASSASNGGTTTKGGWETPVERAAKQIYIVRQSSLNVAANALTVGAKTPPKPEDLIEYARRLEAFVFESDKTQATVNKDVGTIESMDEDIPY